MMCKGLQTLRGTRQYFTLPGLFHVESMEWGVDSMEWWMDSILLVDGFHGMVDGFHTFPDGVHMDSTWNKLLIT